MKKSEYAEKLLIIGITFFVCAFYFHSQDLFTSKKSLIKRNGEVDKSIIYYNLVKSSKGSISTRAELVFKLKSCKSFFVLMENIGNDYTSQKFEKINKQLKTSGTAIVWIRKSEIEEYQPKVFQIADKNNTIIYSFEEAKSHSKEGFLFTFIFGVLGLGGFFILKYWSKLFKTNEK